MVIDQTRYKAFWANPEYYRIKYLNDLADRIDSSKDKYGRDRGTAFHILTEEAHTQPAQSRLDEEVVSEKAKTMARSMYQVYKAATNPKFKRLAVEVPFLVPIEDSPHSMAGRIDSILEMPDGPLMCGETKTAGIRADLAKIKWEWLRNPQADFEIIGARSAGYNVAGVLVHTIKEASPRPRVWQIEVTRSPQQLAILKRNVHQTCEVIEMLKAKFGIDQPWPHVAPGFNPCMQTGYCDFEGDCSQSSIDSTLFAKREEHLEVLRGEA